MDDPVRGSLHFYASAPVLQIGPVALLAVLAFLPSGTGPALVAWQVLGAAAGLGILWQIWVMARDARRDLTIDDTSVRVGLAAVFFLPVWMDLAVGSAHVDDVLALTCGVVGVRLARAGRPILAGPWSGSRSTPSPGLSVSLVFFCCCPACARAFVP